MMEEAEQGGGEKPVGGTTDQMPVVIGSCRIVSAVLGIAERFASRRSQGINIEGEGGATSAS